MTPRKQIEGVVERMRAVATDATKYREGMVTANRVRTWAREIEVVLKSEDEPAAYANGCPILSDDV